MKETEFKALISLLEDDDPTIGKHIEGKLLSLGEGIIPRLEAAWEEEADTDIQQRLEDIIYLIQIKGTIEELQAWMEEETVFSQQAWQEMVEHVFLITSTRQQSPSQKT